jgi:hypothetical protein
MPEKERIKSWKSNQISIFLQNKSSCMSLLTKTVRKLYVSDATFNNDSFEPTKTTGCIINITL